MMLGSNYTNLLILKAKKCLKSRNKFKSIIGDFINLKKTIMALKKSCENCFFHVEQEANKTFIKCTFLNSLFVKSHLCKKHKTPQQVNNIFISNIQYKLF